MLGYRMKKALVLVCASIFSMCILPATPEAHNHDSMVDVVVKPAREFRMGFSDKNPGQDTGGSYMDKFESMDLKVDNETMTANGKVYIWHHTNASNYSIKLTAWPMKAYSKATKEEVTGTYATYKIYIRSPKNRTGEYASFGTASGTELIPIDQYMGHTVYFEGLDTVFKGDDVTSYDSADFYKSLEIEMPMFGDVQNIDPLNDYKGTLTLTYEGK